jgi:spermidine synthase
LISHGIDTTIVEIDPVVHKFAVEYFQLPHNHTIMIQDAMTFVKDTQNESKNPRRYDYIVHDVFTGGVEPVGLFTYEFLKGLENLLKEDGVIAIVRRQLYRRLLLVF